LWRGKVKGFGLQNSKIGCLLPNLHKEVVDKTNFFLNKPGTWEYLDRYKTDSPNKNDLMFAPVDLHAGVRDSFAR